MGSGFKAVVVTGGSVMSPFYTLVSTASRSPGGVREGSHLVEIVCRIAVQAEKLPSGPVVLLVGGAAAVEAA